MHPWRIFFRMTILLSLLSRLAASQDSHAVGVVIQMTGVSTLWTGHRAQPLTPLCVLHPGDSVHTDGRVTILWDNGRTQSVNGAIRVEPLAGKAVDVMRLSNLDEVITRFVALRNGHRDVQRSGTAAGAELLFPRNSNLLEFPSRLIWKGSDTEASYEITVRSYSSDFFYRDIVAGQEMQASGLGDLVDGEQYYWFVHAVGQPLGDVTPAAWFARLDSDRRTEYETELSKLRQLLGAEVPAMSLELLQVNLMLRYELYEDSKLILDRWWSQTSDNEVVRSFYGVVCYQLGLADHFEQAVELTKKAEKSDKNH